MKWGVRRYQNPDGSLTDAGKKRYYKDIKNAVKNRHDTVTANSISEKTDSKINELIVQNSQVFKNLKNARKAFDNHRIEFENDKDKVQKNILLSYDSGVPFDDFNLKEINGDVTPSLLKLANNSQAIGMAYDAYINFGDGREEYKKLDKNYSKAIKAYSALQEQITTEILGKYGNKPIQTLDRRHNTIYTTGESIVNSVITNKLNGYLKQ